MNSDTITTDPMLQCGSSARGNVSGLVGATALRGGRGVSSVCANSSSSWPDKSGSTASTGGVRAITDRFWTSGDMFPLSG